MKGVIDDIRVRAVGVDEWELLEEVEWDGIIVPAGFITDFASIPRPVKALINPVGRIRAGALVHDYLYHVRGELPDRKLTRRECDQIFLTIMKYSDMPFIKRHLAYRGVRLGGWLFWRKPKGSAVVTPPVINTIPERAYYPRTKAPNKRTRR